MTDIERLEAEIAEKKAELHRLKEEANPKLRYNAITDPIREKYDSFFLNEKITIHLRQFVLSISSFHEYKRSDGSVSLTSTTRDLKVSEIGAEKLKICNCFISEIAPIVVKYMLNFGQLNEEEYA